MQTPFLFLAQRLLLTLTIATGLFSRIISLSAQQYPAQGLIAHYPLDGNGYDVGPYAAHGIQQGNNLWSTADRSGNSGGAVYFNNLPATGSTYYQVPQALIASVASQLNGDFTIACWVQPASFYGDGATPASTIFEIGNESVAYFPQLSFGSIQDNQGNKLVYVSNTIGWPPVESAYRPQWQTGAWHHIAMVIKQSVVTFYLDGYKIGGGAFADGESTSPQDYGYIGFSPFGGDDYFDGGMDDLRVYNRALSDGEVATLAEVVLPDLSQPLAHYPLDGNGNDTGPYAAHANGTIGSGIIATATDRNGNPTGAVYFSGAGYTIPFGKAMNFLQYLERDYTLSAWVKLDAVNPNAGYQTIFEARVQHASGSQFEWLLHDNNVFRADWEYSALFINADWPSPGSGNLNLCGASAWDSPTDWQQWHHYAVVVNDGIITHYLDGIPLASAPPGLPAAFTDGPSLITSGIAYFTLGAEADGNYPLNGYLDDMLIYGRPLTDQEIRTLAGAYNGTALSVTGAVGTNTIDLIVSGNQAPYTFAWTDGPTTEDRSGLAKGHYQVTVADSNGCQMLRQFAIAGCQLQATASITAALCGNDGIISMTPAGGKPPYLYALNGGSYQSGNTFAQLAPSLCTVTVQDQDLLEFKSEVGI